MRSGEYAIKGSTLLRNSSEQHEKDIQRIKALQLMDDDFMTAFFRDNIDDTRFYM